LDVPHSFRACSSGLAYFFFLSVSELFDAVKLAIVIPCRVIFGIASVGRQGETTLMDRSDTNGGAADASGAPTSGDADVLELHDAFKSAGTAEGSGIGNEKANAEEEEEQDDEGSSLSSSYSSVNIDKLNDLHDEFLGTLNEYFSARKMLELQFQERFGAIFRKRAAVISGKDDEAEGIPGFWTHCMMSNPLSREWTKPKDADVLDLIVDIRSCHLANPISEDFAPSASNKVPTPFGFRLEFEFAENEFFENRILHKTYRVPQFYSSASYETLEVDAIVPCVVLWKNDELRDVLCAEGGFMSFFDASWMEKFNDKTLCDDDELPIVEDLAKRDFRVALELHHRVIPEALPWFIGVKPEANDQEECSEDSAQGAETSQQNSSGSPECKQQ